MRTFSKEIAAMYQNFRNLLEDARGNTVILFAIAIVPVLLAAGSAVDYLRYTKLKTGIQAAVDGAAMAAALPVDISDAERTEIAKSYFQRNLVSSSIDVPNLDVIITAETVTASTATVMPTSLMGLAGVNVMEIEETSEVIRPFAGQAEVVLVLDYSGSMKDNNKYQRMSAAAVNMISALDSGIADDKLKVGLVPFSSMVYTSMSADYVTQNSGSSVWTGCIQDRIYPLNTTVDTPTSSGESKWGYYDNTKENTGKYGCSVYQNNGLKIVPLSDDLTAVKTQLNTMIPLGNTNIALGTEFGWNLLDPALPYDEALPYKNATNRKFLILLTDGVQTSAQWGPGSTRNIKNAEPNLLALCTAMRNAKITVFTIAYDITDPAVTNMLSSCSPDRYFEPDVAGAEINAVFSQITKQIQNRIARLSK
jgi:Flp pilus assembly protein TadG